jgi:hypothetical protein
MHKFVFFACFGAVFPSTAIAETTHLNCKLSFQAPHTTPSETVDVYVDNDKLSVLVIPKKPGLTSNYWENNRVHKLEASCTKGRVCVEATVTDFVRINNERIDFGSNGNIITTGLSGEVISKEPSNEALYIDRTKGELEWWSDTKYHCEKLKTETQF